MCSNSRWGFLIKMHFYFQKTRFHVSNTLKYRNGYPQQHPPTVGLGGERLKYNQLSEAELDELANKVPTLTYGQAKQAPPETFVPAHLAFDKKVRKKI